MDITHELHRLNLTLQDFNHCLDRLQSKSDPLDEDTEIFISALRDHVAAIQHRIDNVYTYEHEDTC